MKNRASGTPPGREKKSPPEKWFYRTRHRSPVMTHVDTKERIMFDFIINIKNSGRKNSVPRPSLYCVWIRAQEGENAPLIRVWIDTSMSVFDSQARVHEPDLAAAQAKTEATLSLEDKS
jgi:hypothetical protein